MGKVEAIIKSEIVRLAKKEMRRVATPLRRDIRSLRSNVSQLRKTVLSLERFIALQKKEWEKKPPLKAGTPSECGPGGSGGIASFSKTDSKSPQTSGFIPEGPRTPHRSQFPDCLSMGERCF